MADSLVPASAQAERHGLATTPEANCDTKTSEIEASDALSNKADPSPPVTLQQALHKSDMDATHEHRFGRHETFESISSFGNRTNTFASVMSTTTDITEPDQDPATLHDEEEGNASSSRLCRSSTPDFGPLLSRSQSFNVMDHHDSPRSGHSNDEPDVRLASHRLNQLRAGDRNQHALPIRQASGAQPSTSPLQRVGRSEDTSADPVAQTQEPTATSHVHGNDTSVADDVDNWTPEEMSDVHSEDMGDSDMSSNKLDDEIVQDACDKLLKHVFGVELQDLAGTDVGSEAYSSVRYCLESLSRILPSGPGSYAPSVLQAQVMSRNGGSSHHGSPSASNRPSPQGGRNGGSGNGGGGGQKRPQDSEDSPGRDWHDDINGGGGGGGKRPRTENPKGNGDLNLSCPFRKRNPVKFNIRDFQSCAVQSFPDISQLKRHVKIFHKQKVGSNACPRCKRDMETKEDLDIHLNAPSNQICDPHEAPTSQNPEDGISAKIEDVLNGRRANTKVDSWKILWQTLFPNDRSIPPEQFVPPIEFDEVYTEFQTQRWHDMLRERVSEEERSAAGSDEDIEDHITRIVEICEDSIYRFFCDYRELKIGNHPLPKRRRRVGAGGGQKQSVSPKLLDHSQSTLTPLVGQSLGLRIAVSNGSSPHSSPHDTGSANGSYLGSQPTSQIEDMATPTARSSQFDFPAVSAYPGLGVTTTGLGGSLPNRTRPYDSSPIDRLVYQEEPHHSRIPSGDSAVSFNEMTFHDPIYQQTQMYGQQQGQATFQGGDFTGPMMGSNEAGAFPMPGPMTTMAGSGAIPSQVLAFTQHMGSNGFRFTAQQGYNNRS